MSSVTVTEAEMQALIVEAAGWGGWMVYHTFDSRRSQPGFPDLILVRDGVMMAWELKSGSGRVTPEQQAWVDALALIPGVTACVIRPGGLSVALRRLTTR